MPSLARVVLFLLNEGLLLSSSDEPGAADIILIHGMVAVDEARRREADEGGIRLKDRSIKIKSAKLAKVPLFQGCSYRPLPVST